MTIIDRDAESELGAMARVYAVAGLLVFPVWWPEGGTCACPSGSSCSSPGKHPMTTRGVNGASTDIEAIYNWWQVHPKANIGLPAGANDFAVLDVDPRHGGDESLARLRDYLTSAGQPLPDTLTQATGSGGQHLVYHAPDGGVKGKANAFGPNMIGLDTRGRGGYIVAAPSVHAAGYAYQWIDFFADPAPWPALLSQLMDPPKPAPDPFDVARTGGGQGYAAKALENEVTAVRASREPGRNNRLNEAAFSVGTLLGAGLLDEGAVVQELYSAAVACGLGEREAALTIASGIAAGKANPRER